jgi:hypothetical protein
MASKIARGWDLAVRAGRRAAATGGRGGDALAVAAAHALEPGRVGVGRAVARGLHHRGEREIGRREQFHLAAAVVDQLAGIVGEADEARLRKHRRRSVAELIVEPAPDEQHDVGLAHGGAAHRGGDRGMIGGHQAAVFLRVEVEGAGGVEEAQQRRSGAARPAPGDDERALRRPEHIDRRGDRRRLGQQPARRLGLHPLVEHELRRHMGTQHVDRDFGVDRAGLAGITGRARHRLVELAHDLLGDVERPRRARDRPDMRDALQRPHVCLRTRRAAADQQDRSHWPPP